MGNNVAWLFESLRTHPGVSLSCIQGEVAMKGTPLDTWLPESDIPRFNAIVLHVESLWKSAVDPQTYTPHDPAHFRRVDLNIRGLVTKDRWHLLNDEERFLLSC